MAFYRSSNLAANDETGNSENLIINYDQDTAVGNDVETSSLYDPFRFPSLREGSTGEHPLEAAVFSVFVATIKRKDEIESQLREEVDR